MPAPLSRVLKLYVDAQGRIVSSTVIIDDAPDTDHIEMTPAEFAVYLVERFTSDAPVVEVSPV